jgi:mycothiol synthase
MIKFAHGLRVLESQALGNHECALRRTAPNSHRCETTDTTDVDRLAMVAASSLGRMARSRTPDVLSTPDRRAVERFLAAARPRGCSRLSGALSDDPEIVTGTAVWDSTIVGYAQSIDGESGYTVDCVADDPPAREQLVNFLIAALPDHVEVTWWGHELASDAALAATLHMPPPYRRLLNMSRPLPLEPTPTAKDVEVRAFVIGQDEQAWLDVNNAAFSWHHEQGCWDLATLHQRMSRPWFDLAGFLLHERDGRLAAFCWTKVHANGVGEIYVIAVHPDFHGLGLGRALTVAGLRHLSDIGSNEAMLYVEADNTAAVRLYESLGFYTAHTDVAYHRPGTGDNR